MTTLDQLTALAANNVADADLAQLLIYALKNNGLTTTEKERYILLSELRKLMGDAPATSGSGTVSAAPGDKLKFAINGANAEIVLPSTGLSITTRPIEILVANSTPLSYGLIVSSSAKINGGTSPLYITAAYTHLVAAYLDSTHGWVVSISTPIQQATLTGTVGMVTYSGNNTLRDITGLGIYPSWFLIKCRNVGYNWAITNYLTPLTYRFNQSGSRYYSDAQSFLARLTDGYTIGTSSDLNNNNSGGITPTYIAYGLTENDSFRIISYTGNGSTQTIPHGLKKKPAFILIKSATNTDTSWYCYHQEAVTSFASNYFDFSGGGGIQTSTAVFPTEPDIDYFYIGNNASVNTNGALYHAYIFANKTGFQSFGSYTGNGDLTGNSGPVINCGFQPVLWMVRKVEGSSTYIWDNLRGPSDFNYQFLEFNSSTAENTNSGLGVGADRTSTGFKIRSTSGTEIYRVNENGKRYIYMALR